MILAFLMKVFFKIVYEIIAFIVNGIIFLLKALGTILKELFLAIVQAARESRINRIEKKNNKSIENVPKTTETIENVETPKTSSTIAYVIVRRNVDETWTQSKPILSYDEARKQLNKERNESKYPRLLKQVYI